MFILDLIFLFFEVGWFFDFLLLFMLNFLFLMCEVGWGFDFFLCLFKGLKKFLNVFVNNLFDNCMWFLGVVLNFSLFLWFSFFNFN